MELRTLPLAGGKLAVIAVERHLRRDSAGSVIFVEYVESGRNSEGRLVKRTGMGLKSGRQARRGRDEDCGRIIAGYNCSLTFPQTRFSNLK